ncbi:MAG: glycerol kinase GlpK [Candidatus Nezhaarchaeales archaeon]
MGEAVMYIMAIDSGTTGSRVGLFNEEGKPVAWCYREHTQIYPHPGWVEHNPIEIWENVKYCIKEVVAQSNVKPKEIAGIGVTNQRETIVAWNPKTGIVYGNALVWQDRRTVNYVEYLRENYLEMIKERTGLIPDPYFSSTKIWWMLENIESLREKAKRGEAVFGTIDTWIIWNLTRGSKENLTPEFNGAFVTDYSNASRSMIFNIRKLEWDLELAEVQGMIPIESLPLTRPSIDREIYGYTGLEMRSILGSVEVPIAGDAGDQQAALFGQACFSEGDVKCTYGTGNFILLSTGRSVISSRHGLLVTVYYSDKPKSAYYALEGSIFVTGAAIQWLRDGLKIIEVSAEVDPLAEAAEDTGGVYFVPAFTGLGAPYWDPYARGLIIGITRNTTRRHIARAALESIAYLTRDVVEVMKLDARREISILKADGGASRSNFLMQFQADVLGIKVIRPVVYETTSLGAAFMAGLATGVWKSLEELSRVWKPEKVFEPKMSFEEREKRYANWRAAVKRALNWAKEAS